MDTKLFLSKVNIEPDDYLSHYRFSLSFEFEHMIGCFPLKYYTITSQMYMLTP